MSKSHTRRPGSAGRQRIHNQIDGRTCGPSLAIKPWPWAWITRVIKICDSRAIAYDPTTRAEIASRSEACRAAKLQAAILSYPLAARHRRIRHSEMRDSRNQPRHLPRAPIGAVSQVQVQAILCPLP